MNVSAAGKAVFTLPLLARVTCPHCWETFAPENTLWIAQHPDLTGDPRLGQDHPQRFLPTRFNLAGAALDARGFACHGLACPKCHLAIPRPLFEMPLFFLSILGAPASGKSYFLASMTWQLRHLLPQHFALAFHDADAALNHRLQQYESQHFLNPDPDALVAIEKTQTHGDLYDTVLYSDQAVSYPRPFLFTISPLERHPYYASAAKAAHSLCVYDNAGESFLPGEDTATNPVTRHLAHSNVLLFLFDPTQDLRFRHACSGRTGDPQMRERARHLERERPIRQETILLEAAQRVRRYGGLASTAKHPGELIVVVTKYDCWAALQEQRATRYPWTDGNNSVAAVDTRHIEAVSQAVRQLLVRLSPETVAAAESFSSRVLYVPVSATGSSPEAHPATGALSFRPRNIKPFWAEVPLLYAMAHAMRGTVWSAHGSHAEPAAAPVLGTQQPLHNQADQPPARPTSSPDRRL